MTGSCCTLLGGCCWQLADAQHCYMEAHTNQHSAPMVPTVMFIRFVHLELDARGCVGRTAPVRLQVPYRVDQSRCL
ncbi:hypothetical protein B0T11DRAFT_270047 [Plectosphaerella cucumerina]|uniref:Secreted protein n=1 Tax=Plectosphaerella cucumerina TaxID=40658 RepID=A0A8K0TN29_9PEZI|nr:hypothetical protein B0T11DRAFT_270047 [Plectosphaerella cucumerina]